MPSKFSRYGFRVTSVQHLWKAWSKGAKVEKNVCQRTHFTIFLRVCLSLSLSLQGRTQHSSKVANEPPARNQPAFFFFFLLSLTEAWFLTNESKANEFDRRSFVKLELRKSRSWSWRRTAAVDADGLGGVLVIHRGRDRQRQGVNVVHKA